MEWLLLALASAVFAAVGAIVDKTIFNRYKNDPVSFQVIIAVANLPVLVGYYLIARPVLDATTLAAAGVGALMFLAIILYNKCMKKEDASRVVALSYLQPIIIFVLGFFLLGESGSVANVVGILLLILSAILISYKRTGKAFRFENDILLMMLAYDVMVGIRYIVVRWSTGLSATPHTPLDMMFWILCGSQVMAYATLVLSKQKRECFAREAKRMGFGGWALREYGNLIDLLGVALLFYALSLHSAAEISALTAAQPFFVFLFSAIIFKLSPKTMHEDLGSASIIQKLAAFALIVLGSWLIVS